MKYTLLIICLLATARLTAQDFQSDAIFQDDFLGKEFIEKHFKGGYDGYASFFRENLNFPKPTYQNQLEGLLLFKFEVNPVKKEIRTEFLTLIDKHVENNVKDALALSIPEWEMKEDKWYEFYQPIIYSMLPYYPQTLEGDIPDIPIDLPLKFLQPFVLIKSKRIPKDFNLEEDNGEEAKEYEKKVYTRAVKAYNLSVAQKNDDIAYTVLSTLIRFNPLNAEYLLARIQLEKKLKINRYQAYDAMLLSDFVDKDN